MDHPSRRTGHSAGLTIWRRSGICHGHRPALLGAPRYSLLFFSEFFVPCFSAGPKQCASTGPQRAQVPQKTRGPKKSSPNVFFLFPVLVFQRGAPKSPGKVLRKRYSPQYFKIKGPRSNNMPRAPRNVNPALTGHPISSQ